jgi:hypothetical protein
MSPILCFRIRITRRKYLETDLLVYAAGTLFCVEIKTYRGVISQLVAS